ncbi:MAG TPA: hypothetical protein VH440_04095 [Candidatus Limnocylindrales bacterium]
MTARHPDRTPRVRAAFTVMLVTLLLVALGCATQAPSGSAPSAASPAAGSSGDATGSGGPRPSATPWPRDAVTAITALGAGDSEIAKAVADFSEATAAEDLTRMRGAAIGLDNLVKGLTADVDRIAAYEPMAGLAVKYRAAFGPMSTGSQALVKALDAGDANGITAAIQQITDGFVAYGAVRQELDDWVGQLPDQQHFYVG